MTGRPLRSFARLTLISACALLSTSGLDADVVVLTNGNEIQGEVISESSEWITVQFPGGTLRLARRKVKEIRKQSHYKYLLEEGEKALRQKRFERAIETLEKALEERPDSDQAQRALCSARNKYSGFLQNLNRYSEALDTYSKILELDPAHKEAKEGIEIISESQEEARREILQARAELADGDFETSLIRLERLYKAYPDERDEIRMDLSRALIDAGIKGARAKKWSEAAEFLHSAATVAPENIRRVRALFIRCKMEEIAPLIQKNDIAGIEPLARKGLEVAPEDDYFNYYLAVSLEGKDRGITSREIYCSLLDINLSSVGKLDIFELRRRVEVEVLDKFPSDLSSIAKSVLPQRHAITTKHFTVVHQNDIIGKRVSRVAERFYKNLFRRLGGNSHWQGKCEIIIYPTQEAYLEQSELGSWAGASHELIVRSNRFTGHRIQTFQTQGGLTEGVLQHEITHAMLLNYLNNSNKIPLWMNEGFAVREGPEYLKSHYATLLRTEFSRAALIPIRQLLTAEEYPDARRVSLFYAQSLSLVNYLIRKKGFKTFLSYLNDVSRGEVSQEEALKEHYRLRSLTALENRWHSSLNAKKKR